MKLFKQSILFTLVLTLLITACNKNSADEDILTNNNIAITGSQEVPAVPSAATGKMEASYNKRTKLMTYRITWSGLARPVTGMHIHGLADPGTNAGIVQNIIASSNAIATPDTTKYGVSSTIPFNGTLTADEVVIKESELLNGKFYINIHNAAWPGGEIRGQITFPQ